MPNKPQTFPLSPSAGNLLLGLMWLCLCLLGVIFLVSYLNWRITEKIPASLSLWAVIGVLGGIALLAYLKKKAMAQWRIEMDGQGLSQWRGRWRGERSSPPFAHKKMDRSG